jgi:hypothetical protein
MDAAGAGALVEVVYVLGAEVEAVAESFFYFCEGYVGGVWLCGESVTAALGVKAPD